MKTLWQEDFWRALNNSKALDNPPSWKIQKSIEFCFANSNVTLKIPVQLYFRVGITGALGLQAKL